MHLLSFVLDIDMAKVGYIFKANSYDEYDADKEWMCQYGCVQVIEESVQHETLRPRWKQLMTNLERGDELVVSKFSNAVRGLRELAALIELCRIKVVRMVIRLQQSISVPVKTSKMLSKTERDKIAVDMYNNGYSVNEIMAHCNVKSKSTVYQILGKYNVALSRKPGRVPGNRK